MKRYVICTFVDTFEFPLREALRKQVWWKAQEKKKNFEVEIVVFHSCKKSIVYEGIKIHFVDKNRVSSYQIKADFIDYIISIVELRSIMAFLSNGEKTLTICDGYPLGENKTFLRKIVLKFLPYIFKDIYVFSDYQKSLLGISTIMKTSPLLPNIKKKKVKKYKNPTLLYMGHLSYFKGVDTLLASYKLLKEEIDNLDLIIANNMVRGDNKLLQEVEKLKQQYPNNIILKGVIDPIEELSKAWIYIYPFTKPGGTMSYALSLYESQQCGTPFIACNVGANEEFFGKDNLIQPNSVSEMINKIKEILQNEYS